MVTLSEVVMIKRLCEETFSVNLEKQGEMPTRELIHSRLEVGLHPWDQDSCQ